MIDEQELDARLRAHATAARERDSAMAPAFDAMFARARTDATSPQAFAPRWSRRRVLMWGAPILVAAGLGAVLVIPERLKEREFDRTVEEWSRTEAALRSPTDGLLSVPGSEFLGRGPSIAGSADRRGS